MARGRMLSNSLSTSRKYAALAEEPLAEFCWALYPLLVSHADDEGRIEGDPWTVKMRVLPPARRTLEEFQTALTALTAVGLLERADVAGRVIYTVTQFSAHQRLKRPAASMLPWPEDAIRALPTNGNRALPTNYPGSVADRALARGNGVRALPTKRALKEGRKEGINSARVARDRTLLRSAAAYLDTCPHEPICTVARTCGQLRALDDAFRGGRVSVFEYRRLRQLWSLSPQLLEAAPRPRARRRG